MEYLSAIGTLLIVLFFGGGLVIVAYLTFDDMRARTFSWKAGTFSETVTSVTDRLKALPAGPSIVAAAVLAGAILVYSAAGSFEPAPAPTAVATEDSTPAATTAPPPAPAPEKTAAAPAQPAPAAPAPSKGSSNAMASMATPGAVRTVTSSSCSTDGCPVSCNADEILGSAYCISGGAARLSDQLQVKDGVVTAKCSPGASSISVSCARK